jgi:hypothetical protein
MAGSGSTGVAGIWFLATPSGGMVWKSLASVSALLAVYHSVTRPSEAIRKLETQVTGWAQLEHLLSDVRRRIHELKRYGEPLQKEVKSILDQKQSIFTGLIDTNTDETLRTRCFERVKKELPPEVFFIPET